MVPTLAARQYGHDDPPTIWLKKNWLLRSWPIRSTNPFTATFGFTSWPPITTGDGGFTDLWEAEGNDFPKLSTAVNLPVMILGKYTFVCLRFKMAKWLTLIRNFEFGIDCAHSTAYNKMSSFLGWFSNYIRKLETTEF